MILKAAGSKLSFRDTGVFQQYLDYTKGISTFISIPYKIIGFRFT